MDQKPTSRSRFFRIFWLTSGFGLAFIALATIRYYFKPESVSRVLLFAGFCLVAIVLTVKVLAAVSRRLFRKQTRWWLLLWIVCVIALTPLLINAEPPYGTQSAGGAMLLAMARSAVAILAIVVLLMLIRWLCRPRNRRWFLAAFAVIALVVMGFYIVENWRGKRAWENYKREWEARGEKFDLLSFAPSPVPDAQNFALSPVVASCYLKKLGSPQEFQDGGSDTNNRLNLPLERAQEPSASYPTNIGNWQRGIPANLEAWQAYYRLTSITNLDLEEDINQDSITGETFVSTRVVESNVVAVTVDFPIAATAQTPAEDVLLALSKYDEVIQELREASRLPYARVPLDYATDDPGMMLLPHLRSFKDCSQVLRLRAIAELKAGQADAALADVKLALRLMETLQNEPILISQLVRVAIWQLTVQPIWEGLAEHRWNDAQLTEMETLLAKLDFISSYTLAMHGERACMITIIDHWQSHRAADDSAVGSMIYSACPAPFDFIQDQVPESVADFLSPLIPSKLIERVLVQLPPIGWFHLNKLAAAEAIRLHATPFFDASTRAIPSGVITNLARMEAELYEKRRSPTSVFVAYLQPALSKSAMRVAHAQASADMARIACALERYRLANGEYPETLDTLVPRFMSRIPHDIIHGSPLNYRRNGNGQFVLYSIGWNETDDGGVVDVPQKTVRIEKGDWVWWSSMIQ